MLCGKPFQQNKAGPDELLGGPSDRHRVSCLPSSTPTPAKWLAWWKFWCPWFRWHNRMFLHARPPPRSCVTVRQTRLHISSASCAQSKMCLLHHASVVMCRVVLAKLWAREQRICMMSLPHGVTQCTGRRKHPTVRGDATHSVRCGLAAMRGWRHEAPERRDTLSRRLGAWRVQVPDKKFVMWFNS